MNPVHAPVEVMLKSNEDAAPLSGFSPPGRVHLRQKQKTLSPGVNESMYAYLRVRLPSWAPEQHYIYIRFGL